VVAARSSDVNVFALSGCGKDVSYVRKSDTVKCIRKCVSNAVSSINHARLTCWAVVDDCVRRDSTAPCCEDS
jgi:hypothetical protein